MKWKLGVVVCSDECKLLNLLFVVMIFKVVDVLGKILIYIFELIIL